MCVAGQLMKSRLDGALAVRSTKPLSIHPHRIGALTRAFATVERPPRRCILKDDIRPGKFLYVLGAIRALLPAGANQRAPPWVLRPRPSSWNASPPSKRDARAALIRAGGLAD